MRGHAHALQPSCGIRAIASAGGLDSDETLRLSGLPVVCMAGAVDVNALESSDLVPVCGSKCNMITSQWSSQRIHVQVGYLPLSQSVNLCVIWLLASHGGPDLWIHMQLGYLPA